VALVRVVAAELMAPARTALLTALAQTRPSCAVHGYQLEALSTRTLRSICLDAPWSILRSILGMWPPRRPSKELQQRADEGAAELPAGTGHTRACAPMVDGLVAERLVRNSHKTLPSPFISPASVVSPFAKLLLRPKIPRRRSLLLQFLSHMPCTAPQQPI
jgi:hypothetical protein